MGIDDIAMFSFFFWFQEDEQVNLRGEDCPVAHL